jgi:UDP-N-acetylglucosamine acyltransferase
MANIHPAAIVDARAEVAETASIGAFSIIDADVSIGEGTQVGPHAVIRGPTTIGKRNRIFQFASLGEEPQDKKYRGERTSLEIGDDNLIREYVTINRGTVQDAGVTRVGNDNWLMAHSHVAHDCQLGSHTIFANAASIAGHVHVGDWAVLGGFTVVHQFCHIGAHAITAMGSVVLKDVPPFVTAAGNTARPFGINIEGMRRRGFSREAITHLRHAFKLLYKSTLTVEEAKAAILGQCTGCPETHLLVEFLGTCTRGIIR